MKKLIMPVRSNLIFLDVCFVTFHNFLPFFVKFSYYFVVLYYTMAGKHKQTGKFFVTVTLSNFTTFCLTLKYTLGNQNQGTGLKDLM